MSDDAAAFLFSDEAWRQAAESFVDMENYPDAGGGWLDEPLPELAGALPDPPASGPEPDFWPEPAVHEDQSALDSPPVDDSWPGSDDHHHGDWV